LYTQIHRGQFLYDHAAGRWYKWTGYYWQEDFLNEALVALEKIINLYSREAKMQAWNWVKAEKAGKKDNAEKYEEIYKKLLKRIRDLQSKRRKEEVLFLARTGVASLAITGQEWDRDPWILGCLIGVIDLRTGKPWLRRPQDFIKIVELNRFAVD
jgi:putative DNA primase/helicase